MVVQMTSRPATSPRMVKRQFLELELRTICAEERDIASQVRGGY